MAGVAQNEHKCSILIVVCLLRLENIKERLKKKKKIERHKKIYNILKIYKICNIYIYKYILVMLMYNLIKYSNNYSKTIRKFVTILQR